MGIDIPTFALHGNGSLTLEGINIIVTDIRVEDHEEGDTEHNLIVEYSITDDVMPSDIDEFEHALCRFMMSLA